MPIDDLKNNAMMANLLNSLEQGQDIGHYGRLVFAMVGRHFLEEDEVIEWLAKDADCDEEKARALLEQVEDRGYNPPRRERILQWMKEQEFPICSNTGDPNACNVYKDLKFPEEVYKHITEYREEKSQAEHQAA